MSYPSFTSAAATVDRFLTLLEDCGVELMGTGRAGGEALAMSDVIEMWRDPTRRPADPRPVVRAAMGFVDLAGKVLSVSTHPSFVERRDRTVLRIGYDSAAMIVVYVAGLIALYQLKDGG